MQRQPRDFDARINIVYSRDAIVTFATPYVRLLQRIAQQPTLRLVMPLSGSAKMTNKNKSGPLSQAPQET